MTGKHAAFDQRRGSEGARSGTRPEVRRPSQAESSDGSPQERKTPGMMMSSRDLNKRLRMERSNTMELADRRASAIRKERELKEAKLPTAWKWESAPMVLHLCGASAYTVDAKTLRWLLQEPAPPTAAQRLCFCQHAASRQAAWREPASAGLDAAARVPEKLRGVMAVGDGASVSLHTCAVAQSSAQCCAQFSAQFSAQFCVTLLSDAPHPSSVLLGMTSPSGTTCCSRCAPAAATPSACARGRCPTRKRCSRISAPPTAAAASTAPT